MDVAIKELERRGSDRFTHASSVLYRGAAGTTFRKAQCLDFGKRGARLSLPEPLPSGSLVALNLTIPDKASSQNRTLSVEATVVWSKPAGRGNEIGVTFQGGGCPPDVRRLESWLHSQVLVKNGNSL